jgi:ketosteroid isomerase-like protein
MRRRLMIRTVASLVTLTAMGDTEALGQSTDVEGVKAAAAAFYASLNARDIGAMEALWARDASPIMIHPSGPHARAPVVGWEAVRRSFAEAWPQFTEFTVTVNEPSEVRVAQRAAVLVAVTPVHIRTRGGETIRYTALATFGYERQDGRWLIVVHHASRVPQ